MGESAKEVRTEQFSHCRVSIEKKELGLVDEGGVGGVGTWIQHVDGHGFHRWLKGPQTGETAHRVDVLSDTQDSMSRATEIDLDWVVLPFPGANFSSKSSHPPFHLFFGFFFFFGLLLFFWGG